MKIELKKNSVFPNDVVIFVSNELKNEHKVVFIQKLQKRFCKAKDGDQNDTNQVFILFWFVIVICYFSFFFK